MAALGPGSVRRARGSGARGRLLLGLLTLILATSGLSILPPALVPDRLEPQQARAADDAGTSSPLMLGAGSRSMAMGRAAAAITDDANALFWNPARLSWVERSEFSLFRSKLFDDDITYHAAFFTYPTLDLGSFAVGYQLLGVDGIERRDDRNFLLGNFDDSESNLLLGYSRRFGDQLALGTNLRLAQQNVGGASDLGLGLDLGIAWEKPLDSAGAHRLGLGANAQNLIEPKLKLDEESVPDPRNLKLGIAYTGAPASSHFGWAVAADLNLPRMADARLGAGAELSFHEALFLWGGVDDSHPTFGFGAQTHGVRFEYALWSSPDLPRNDRFTLLVAFGPTVTQRYELRRLEREQDVREQLETLMYEREQEVTDRARKDADAAYAAADYEAALRQYRSVLLLEPGDEHAARRADACELQLQLTAAGNELVANELGRAAALYQQILERWPEDSRAQRGLERSREQLQRSADLQDQLASLFSIALTRFSQGDFAATRAALDELLRLQPDHELGRELLSRSEQMRITTGEKMQAAAEQSATRHDWADAQSQLDRALQLLPERRSELLALRTAWGQQQADEEAAAVAARKQREAQALTAATLATASTTTKSATGPLSTKRRAELEQLFNQGLSAFQGGDFDRATELWQQVWNDAPELNDVGSYLVKAYLFQGIHLYGQGEYRLALSRCRRVLDIDPENQKARRYLARIQEEQDEIEEIRGE